MRALELKIPPVAQCLLVGAGMWLAGRLVPDAAFGFPGQLLVSSLLLLVAGLVGLAGVRAFLRAGTTANPLAPERASALVATGIYGITRNPMYLSLAVALLAWGMWLGNGVALLGVPLFVVAMNRLQIGPEERALTQLFGAEFDAYRRQVRRWI